MRTKRNSFLATTFLIFLLSLANISAAQERVDLSLTNTASPNPAIVSTAAVPRNLTYGMNVIINGPDPARGVQVTFTIPDRTTLVSATFNFINADRLPCTVTATTVACNVGSMNVGNLAGAAVIVTLRAQATGVLRATGTVTADQSDPDMGNNSVSVETLVEPQVSHPVMTDSNLMVSTVVSGLTTPTSFALLSDNDFLVLEQSSGIVKRVRSGAEQQQPVVLDLPVNFFSEHGLLGIALHPDFETNHFVYLYWTCSSSARLGPCIFDSTPSATDDTNVPDRVPLLGNRVDRFI